MISNSERITKNWAGNTFDRVWRTGLQVFLAYLSVAQLFHMVQWIPAISSALFAMLLSALTSLVAMPSFGEAWYFQVAERAVKTFAQSLLTFIGAAAAFDEVDWRMGFSAAIVATIYSVGTSILTTRVGEQIAKGNVDLTIPDSYRRPTAANGSSGGTGF